MKKYTLNDIKKTMKETNFTTVYFIEPIAIRLTYLIVNHTKLSPNQITFISLSIGIIWFILGMCWLYISSCLFFYFAFIFDNIDWKIARLKKVSTLKWFMLDAIVDSSIQFLYSILLLYIIYIYIIWVFFIILLLAIQYFKLYNSIIVSLFKNNWINISLLWQKNNKKVGYKSKILSMIPNWIDIFYFFHIIWILILINFWHTWLLLIKINIIIVTIYYLILFYTSFLLRYKKIKT